MIVYLELFISFARVSLFGFGGGPSMIPLVRAEVVEGRSWLTPETFLDAFAFGNALPGPIITKLSAYVGHQVAGWPGAAAALAGATLPTMVLILLATRLVMRGKENPVLRAAIGGIRPVVVALLLLVAWDFAPRALGMASASASASAADAVLAWLSTVRAAWPLWAIAAASLIATVRFKVHPVPLIVVGAVLGLLFGLGS
ncbi:MAG TPA: chromate transporter [Trueperaceae bacterium]|nr:chromate transporter [Trueperaceae bacterium]